MKKVLPAFAVLLSVCFSSAEAEQLSAADRITALVAQVQDLAQKVAISADAAKCETLNSSSPAILTQVNDSYSEVMSDSSLADSIVNDELNQVVEAINLLKARHSC